VPRSKREKRGEGWESFSGSTKSRLVDATEDSRRREREREALSAERLTGDDTKILKISSLHETLQ